MRSAVSARGLICRLQRCTLRSPLPHTGRRPLNSASAAQHHRVTPQPATDGKDEGTDGNVVELDHEDGSWALPLPAACVANFCIGLPLGFPLLADALSRNVGVVGAASADWSCAELAVPGVLFLGVQAATAVVASKWQREEGPIMALSMSSVVLACGMGVAAAALHLQELSLLHAGIGCLAGAAAGLAYSPVIQGALAGREGKLGLPLASVTLATGLGAASLPALVGSVSAVLRTLPTYLGPSADFNFSRVGGKLYAVVDGLPTEVIEYTQATEAIAQGLYLAGTGSSGLAESLCVVGAAASALLFTVGQRFHTVPSQRPITSSSDPAIAAPVPAQGPGPIDFHLLGVSSLLLTAAGTALLSLGPSLVNEVLVNVPNLITPELSAVYGTSLVAATIAGRFAWTSLTDLLGNRGTMYALTVGGIPVFLSVPALSQLVAISGETAPLVVLMVNTCIGCSMVGGLHGVVPRYLHSLFGERDYVQYVSKTLPYLSGGVLLGSAILPPLNDFSKKEAFCMILDKIPADQFQKAFGQAAENGRELIATNAISLDALAALVPAGENPLFHIYDKSFVGIVAILTASAIAHARVYTSATAIQVAPKKDFTLSGGGGDKHHYRGPRQVSTPDSTAVSGDNLKRWGIYTPKKSKSSRGRGQEAGDQSGLPSRSSKNSGGDGDNDSGKSSGNKESSDSNSTQKT